MEATTGRGAAADSQNLREFLRVKQDDNHQSSFSRTASGRNFPGMTINGVLADKRGQSLERAPSNRTLLDIIREESGNGNAYKDGRRSWRIFKEKLRLRRNGSGSNWTSALRVPASDVPLNNNSNDRMMMTGHRSFTQFGDSPESTQPNSRRSLDRNASRAMERVSGRFEHTSSLAMRRLQRERNEDEGEEAEKVEPREEEVGGGGGSGGGGEEEELTAETEGGEPVRTSLMALLAETDRQMGLDGLGYMMDAEEEEEEDEEEEERGGGAGGEYNNCCVCMVRHKGAAFIPCGHTFCRLCSRELYAQRGNCPLCNNYILEILDIF